MYTKLSRELSKQHSYELQLVLLFMHLRVKPNLFHNLWVVKHASRAAASQQQEPAFDLGTCSISGCPPGLCRQCIQRPVIHHRLRQRCWRYCCARPCSNCLHMQDLHAKGQLW